VGKDPVGKDPAAQDPAAALAAAVTLLSRRDFCTSELTARLVAQGFGVDVIAPCLEDLRDRHYLDDERYARQFVAAHAQRGHGPLRIRHDLAERGLNAELAETALTQHGEWSARAQEVRARRFGPAPPADWAEKARQARFLQYRGFSHDDIRCRPGI
jgi:regulatory protein